MKIGRINTAAHASAENAEGQAIKAMITPTHCLRRIQSSCEQFTHGRRN
jgi:hypothetical protein